MSGTNSVAINEEFTPRQKDKIPNWRSTSSHEGVGMHVKSALTTVASKNRAIPIDSKPSLTALDRSIRRYGF